MTSVVGVLRREVDQVAHLAVWQRDREDSCLVSVGAEYVRERRRDDRVVARVLDRPRRVLAGRAAAEVLTGDQDRCALVLWPVQYEIAFRSPVIEEEWSVAGALDALEKLFWNYLVGVHVGAVKRRHPAGDPGDHIH